MRAARRLKLRRECVLDARQCFDRAVERKFPAFCTLDLADVARAHLRGQRGGRVFPELGLKHVAILSLRAAPSRANARRGPHARARTIPPESGIGSGRGFSCSECSAAAARLQTMKSHLWHKK